MTRLPGVVFVVDAKKEEIAVREANRLEIPVIAIADTNADPDLLTIPIAGNDDAIRSVSLITGAIADAIETSRREAPEVKEVEEEEEVYTYSSDAGDVEEAAPQRSKRRGRPRRRPRPEVIKKRLQESAVGAEGAELAEPAGAEEPADEGPEISAEAEGADGAPEPEKRTEEVAESPADEEEAERGSSGSE